jgi:hypothetical protein
MEIVLPNGSHRIQMKDARLVSGEIAEPGSNFLGFCVVFSGTGQDERATKEYPVHLKISTDELGEMVRVLTNEMSFIFSFLFNKKLHHEFAEQRRKDYSCGLEQSE